MHVYFAYINYTNFSGTDEASKEVEGEKGKKKKKFARKLVLLILKIEIGYKRTFNVSHSFYSPE